MEIVDIALLVLAAVAASELLLRLPVLRQAQGIAAVTRKSAATIRSRRISDHWKETILPAYSLRMAGRSILFFLLLCAVALPVALAGFAAPGGMEHWIAVLVRPVPILILCGCSVLYIFIRLRLLRG